MTLQAYEVAGIWISGEFAQELILRTREELLWYGSHTDDQILIALDIKGCCPSVAAQFLEGFMADMAQNGGVKQALRESC